MNKTSSSAPRVLRFGAFSADLYSGELRKHGTRIRLQEQPFQVLALLLEHAGNLVTREELRQRLWPADTFVDFDHGLNAAINRLRDRLGDSAEKPRYIETIPRRGYRFLGTVEAEPASPGEAQPSPPDITRAPGRRTGMRGWGAAVMTGALVAAAVFGAYRWQHRAAPVAVHSLAVLPFENYSGDPSQEYFSDGITEELIADLSQISALRVISRTSIMQYKNSRKYVRDIGRELGVDAVLEGSVERSGARVRIRAQLIHAPTDTHLWTRSYERDARDVLQLQDEVARAIADEIRVQLTPSERSRLEAARTVKPEAHEDYLRGLYHAGKRTDPELETGIAYFQKAIAADPGYALAYAGLADAYALRASLLYMAVPPRDLMPQSKAAALKALELDDSMSAGHATLGYIEMVYEWDWARSQQEFRRAIDLNPNDAQAHHRYAVCLMVMGQAEEAIAEMRRARELDPLSLIINSNLGLVLYYARRYDEAIDQLRQTLALEPGFFVAHWELALAYEAKRRYPEALAELEKARTLSPDNPVILESMGEVYVLAGRNKQAWGILTQLTQLSRQRFVPPYTVAALYAVLGADEQAFHWLDRAFDQRDSELIFLNLDPSVRRLHSDPRFQDLLRRMALKTD